MFDRVDHIGDIAVDTGMVMVSDPCQAIPDTEWDEFIDTVGDDDEMEIRNEYGAPIKVMSRTAIGDGIYSVYKCYNNGELVGLFVDIAGLYPGD